MKKLSALALVALFSSTLIGCGDSAPFNKNAKTDQQRIERGIPTLAEITQYLNEQKDCEPIE